MSLDIVIIPFDKNYLSIANDIQSKLTNEIPTIKHNITIDTNYEQLFVSRINKWKKLDYDVVVGIDQYYEEYNCVVVRFSDGARPQNMEINEFVDLIASFEESTEENVNDTPKNTNETEEEDFCIIM